MCTVKLNKCQGAFIRTWALEPLAFIGDPAFIQALASSPPAFITVMCSGFLLVILFVLILSIYVYLVSYRNKELSVSELSVPLNIQLLFFVLSCLDL